ncbi:hypothetical protein A3F34_01550 [Candidatus Roizmanbacteria bacterium RIFCSPHIGHO2_12_FULL_44_10]|uniref:CopG family transcriptional regulator n=1 Tax=Candidatus Roizmanbacteria bacterium RIFCSPHIGHO2_12_FULL_44_10 TaxID=1802054 RepID=A0A1F7I694_9BACT|nr:MAG: hypothetical protein A3F34_01550 [Candidatus Roizmanbacteria bacterium RIFCSPHIGHO2_12_FULL_44_10]
MKKKIRKLKYGDIVEGTFGKMKYVKDFLPPPEQLVFKELTTKVTISLQKDSIDFFKKEAKRLDTSYQRMIRNLLQEYTTRMSQLKK